MTEKLPLDLLKESKETILKRIYDHHLRNIRNSDGKIFYISNTYPGVWLEHVYDGVAWGNYMPNEHSVSADYVRLFIKNQKEDGQLPCYVWDSKVGYSQIQECVAFGRLCIEAAALNPDDKMLLSECYTALKKWDNWLCEKRMTLKTGLIEMFCGFDTGHDNSGRLNGLKYPGNICSDGGLAPTDDRALPIIAPDMNAVFYGDRMAMSEIAERLGYNDEAILWKSKADEVRRKLFELCCDENDMFFYDVDRNGEKRRVRSISITSLFCEKVLDIGIGNDIFERHLHNPNEFWTPYPFPAAAISDPTWVQNRSGNSWGFYTQGNVVLRTMRWMEYYGKSAEMEEVMERWLNGWITSDSKIKFGQELHPITGKPSESSPWYSSCMLFTLHSIRRLYDI